jgi:hypothetical protein
VKVTLYVEGGGDTALLRARCREAFRKLLEKTGLGGKMPRIVASGGRDAAFDDFRTAHRTCRPGAVALLLVDSEEPVHGDAWAHLNTRDGWERPEGAVEEQAQLMVACMETWVVADRAALRRVFGPTLRPNALPPPSGLEERGKDEVQRKLAAATAGCARDRRYEKGKRSFQVVAELDPATLEAALPHFKRLIDTLRGQER